MHLPKMCSIMHKSAHGLSDLNGPHWFTEFTNSRRWVEHYFSSIEAKCKPIKRMMSSIANVHSYFTISCFKHWMPSVTLHVVCALIEITNSWNVILQQRVLRHCKSFLTEGRNRKCSQRKRKNEAMCIPFDECQLCCHCFQL